jgi:hypothetical protein
MGTDSSTESGSNAGSNFYINRATDVGVYIDTPFFINRSNGYVGIGGGGASVGLDVSGTGRISTTNNDGFTITGSSGGTRKGLVLNAPTGMQASILFQENASNVWQILKQSSTNQFQIFDSAGSLVRLAITSGTGYVGIGTSTPAATLDVSGAIISRPFNAGSGTTADFSQSNVVYSSAACGAITLTGMQDGGNYTLVLTGSGTGPATFTHSGLTVKTTGTLTCTSAKHTIFSFLRASTNVYVNMSTGY